MLSAARESRVFGIAAGIGFVVLAGAAVAQQGPVAMMFGDDQKRNAALAPSFVPVDLPPTSGAAFPLRVYLSAGDLERAFDNGAFRPDAAIVPTNTDLEIAASSPATQRVLVDRVRKSEDVMRQLETAIAARRKQSTGATRPEPGVLRIGIDSFAVQLARNGAAPLPKAACLVATDFANGGAVDRRELFAQDRVRQGIAACLDALDTASAASLVLPLMGAGSSKTQTNDTRLEGQRTLKECRLINSTAGIGLGIHDYASRRRNLREIGVIQWDQEIAGMFKVPAGSRAERSAQAAYRVYADQIKEAFQRGLAGQKTTASDLKGSCSGVLDVK